MSLALAPVSSSALVSVVSYRQLTGDMTTPDAVVIDHLVTATSLVAEYLRRRDALEQAVRTETLRVFHLDGRAVVYPRATPVTAVPAGLTIEGAGVVGAAVVGVFFGWAPEGSTSTTVLTYTGGWTDETVPLTVAREIARTAKALTAVPQPQLVGATSVRVGDAAIVYARPLGGALDAVSVAALRPYRRRHQ